MLEPKNSKSAAMVASGKSNQILIKGLGFEEGKLGPSKTQNRDNLWCT